MIDLVNIKFIVLITNYILRLYGIVNGCLFCIYDAKHSVFMFITRQNARNATLKDNYSRKSGIIKTKQAHDHPYSFSITTVQLTSSQKPWEDPLDIDSKNFLTLHYFSIRYNLGFRAVYWNITPTLRNKSEEYIY